MSLRFGVLSFLIFLIYCEILSLKSINIDLIIYLLQIRIYIFWCLDVKVINNWNVYTKMLKKLLTQDN